MPPKLQKALRFTFIAIIFSLLLYLVGIRLSAVANAAREELNFAWGSNTRANSDYDQDQFSQHEPSIAISRTDPNVVVAVAKDYRIGNDKQVWIYVSQDGGQTWPANLQLQIPGMPNDIPNQSDPVAFARDDGRIYVMALGHNNNHGLFLTWTDDNGNTWKNPSVRVAYNDTPCCLDDKEWPAIDNHPDSPYYHNMYVAWANGGILFKRSTDGGETWSTYINLTPGGGTEYPYPVVGADGAVYVFYMDGWGYCADGWIKFRKSIDGGETFSPAKNVIFTSQPCSPIHGDFEYDQFRFFSIITAAADPNDPNNLWVAWTDDNNITYGKTDVLYVRSTDGGANWTSKSRLSHDDPEAFIDHITPVFAIDADSRLHAFWLDRRADPDNVLWHGYHTSTVDGVNWTSDSQVSQEAFDLNLYFPPPAGYNAAGDYWGLDVVNGIVMAAWNTTVEESQDIYVARGTLPVILTGHVQNSDTLIPIDGAEITTDHGEFATTDPSGIYTITLPADVYTITAQATGYYSMTIPDVELVSGTVKLDFLLEPMPTALAGTVIDVDSTEPISGALISMDTGQFTYTNAVGVYFLPLDPGFYTVTAQASGYISQTITGIELIAGVLTQDFALQETLCLIPEILAVEIATGGLKVDFIPTISTPPEAYLWSFGDSFTSTLPAPSHTYAAYGNYSLGLEVSNLCGKDTWSGELRLIQPIYSYFLPLITKSLP